MKTSNPTFEQRFSTWADAQDRMREGFISFPAPYHSEPLRFDMAPSDEALSLTIVAAAALGKSEAGRGE